MMAKSCKTVSIVVSLLLAIVACIFFGTSPLFGPNSLLGPSTERLPSVSINEVAQGEGRNISLLSQMGGLPDEHKTPAVFTDDILFIGLGPRLVSLDLSELPTINQIGQSDTLSGQIDEMLLDRDTLYFTIEGKLYIYDVSDPTNLVSLGFYNASTADERSSYEVFVQSIRHIALYKETLIIDNNQQLTFLDISNPQNIIIQGHYVHDCCLSGMLVEGSNLFLAADEPALKVLDISDPTSLQEVKELYPQSSSSGLAIQDNFLFLEIEEKGINIIDISDPRTLPKIGEYKDNGSISIKAISNDIVYRAEGARVQLIDVADLSNPREIGSLCVSYPSSFIGLSENLMLYNKEGEIIIVDSRSFVKVLSGNTCKELEKHMIRGSFSPINGWSLQKDGQLLYISGADSGIIQAVDVSRPEEPIPLFVGEQGRPIWYVFAKNGYLYSDGFNHADGQTIAVYDFNSLDTPSLAFDHPIEDSIDDIVFENKRAYVTDRNNNFYVFDVTDISKPKLLAKHPPFPGVTRITGFDVAKDHVYLIDNYEDKLHILDFTDPAKPVEISILSAEFSIWYMGRNSIRVFDDFVFIVERYRRDLLVSHFLSVIDVTDPSNPHYLTIYGWCDQCVFGGNSQDRIHTVDNWGIVSLFDFTDPLNPENLGYYGLPMDHVSGPSIDMGENGEIYIVDKQYGLIILQMADAEN